MSSYAVIIFSDPAFKPFVPALSKLVVFHQIMFTLMSSMPFAIDQVQDAGLIFHSAMATSICVTLNDNNSAVSPEANITTTIVTIDIATASLGVYPVIMGRFKMAALVSYLPIPVIGGYLAFIGVFCLYHGPRGQRLLVNDQHDRECPQYSAVYARIPGRRDTPAGLKKLQEPLALSTAIMAMPLFFFLRLTLGSISLDEARQDGWADPVEKTASISELLTLLDFNLVHWSEIPRQTVTRLGMVFIVAISPSSMQLECRRHLIA
ncbi:Sulfate Permease, partial [Phytophthora megakarya]